MEEKVKEEPAEKEKEEKLEEPTEKKPWWKFW
jgi:hypothetical protein